MIRNQRTLKFPFQCRGIGLHSGKPVRLKARPAPADTGVVFIRTDHGNREIAAVAENTGATNYALSLSKNGTTVSTVEHLLSAFAGLGIDNVFVDIDAEEVPIMDGSAGPFMRLIAEAGIQFQEKLQPMLKVLKPVFVREGNKQIAVWPAESTGISCFIDFNHPMLKEQTFQYPASEEFYLREIAQARTFGFLRDVKTLQANGLAKGASLNNAVALGDDFVLNREGLRYRDEFVRHKILDLIGDFSLLGMPVIGHIVAHKSGHAMNALMIGKLLRSPESWITIGVAPASKVKQPERDFRHVHI